jgi:hypothetical protein
VALNTKKSINQSFDSVVSFCFSFYHTNLKLFCNNNVFNATFNNISAISWRPVLVVEEAGVPGENHRPWASNW